MLALQPWHLGAILALVALLVIASYLAQRRPQRVGPTPILDADGRMACPSCREPVQPTATACPHCTRPIYSPDPVRHATRRNLLVVVMLVGVYLLAHALGAI